MKQLIRSLNLNKENTQTEIEEALLKIRDFSPEYYSLQRMNCDSFVEASIEIYEYLQSL